MFPLFTSSSKWISRLTAASLVSYSAASTPAQFHSLNFVIIVHVLFPMAWSARYGMCPKPLTIQRSFILWYSLSLLPLCSFTAIHRWKCPRTQTSWTQERPMRTRGQMTSGVRVTSSGGPLLLLCLTAACVAAGRCPPQGELHYFISIRRGGRTHKELRVIHHTHLNLCVRGWRRQHGQLVRID